VADMQDTIECTKCSQRYDPRTVCTEPGCPMYPLPRQRTIDDKITRLRRRLQAALIDPNVRAILLGVLDLLDDEL
jgi:hypothetical protein